MGVLVSPQNTHALAEGIIGVMQNREIYIQPKEEIEKIFDYNKTLNEYERLFSENWRIP